MNMSQALDGFLFTLKAESYSRATVNLYRIMLTTLSDFLENPNVSEIAAKDLTRYFAYLQTD